MNTRNRHQNTKTITVSYKKQQNLRRRNHCKDMVLCLWYHSSKNHPIFLMCHLSLLHLFCKTPNGLLCRPLGREWIESVWKVAQYQQHPSFAFCHRQHEVSTGDSLSPFHFLPLSDSKSCIVCFFIMFSSSILHSIRERFPVHLHLFLSFCKNTNKRVKNKRKAGFSFYFRMKVFSAKPKLTIWIENCKRNRFLFCLLAMLFDKQRTVLRFRWVEGLFPMGGRVVSIGRKRGFWWVEAGTGIVNVL